MDGFLGVKRFIQMFGGGDDEEMMDRMHPHGADTDTDEDDKKKAAASHTRGGAGGMKELKDAMESTPGGDTRTNKNAY